MYKSRYDKRKEKKLSTEDTVNDEYSVTTGLGGRGGGRSPVVAEDRPQSKITK